MPINVIPAPHQVRNKLQQVCIPTQERGNEKNLSDLVQDMTMETFILSFDSLGTPHKDLRAADGQELVSGDSESEVTVSLGENDNPITITPNTGFIP